MGFLKLYGEENEYTLAGANNYADLLKNLNRLEEAKALMRNVMPVARRVLGDSHELTLRMRGSYAGLLVMNNGATLGDLREAVATLEDTEGTARRVLGGAHPITERIERALRELRAMLRARDTPQED